jgi:hypothetical protein
MPLPKAAANANVEDMLALADGTPLRDAIAELKQLRAEKEALAARNPWGFGCGSFGTELCYSDAMLPHMMSDLTADGQATIRATCESFGDAALRQLREAVKPDARP